MFTVPRNWWPDSTLAFALEGYRFSLIQCDRMQTDVCQTRLPLKKTIFFKILKGGGDHHNNHCCSGERTTYNPARKKELGFLVNAIEYCVPPQDFSFSLSSRPEKVQVNEVPLNTLLPIPYRIQGL